MHPCTARPAAEYARMIAIARNPPKFSDWPGLLTLILDAFAPMHGRIDPPSSALALTPEALADKAGREWLFLAREDAALAGCAFAVPQGEWLYLGKLAVAPALQGQGIGRRLISAIEAAGRKAGHKGIELQTRVELTENHTAFARMGFTEAARTAHPGFARPTSVTMRKRFGGESEEPG